MDKKQAREIAKKTRVEILPENKPLQIAQHFFDNVKTENKIIAAYYPVGNEVDIFPIISQIKNLCLPVIYGESLRFRAWEGELVVNKFAIPEPAETAKLQTPDIVIIPCLGFNKQKYRLGYGGGFYDKTLQNLSVQKIGVAYAAQQIEFVQESHDAKLDLIITENGVIN